MSRIDVPKKHVIARRKACGTVNKITCEAISYALRMSRLEGDCFELKTCFITIRFMSRSNVGFGNFKLLRAVKLRV